VVAHQFADALVVLDHQDVGHVCSLRPLILAFPHKRMAWGPACDDTCGFMRKILVVFVWVVATVGVTYVANAAVELVDLQVFPRGARIEVLARAVPTSTTWPVTPAATVTPATTVVAPPATSKAPPTTSKAPPATTVAPATTVVAPPATSKAPPATTVAPATTVVAPPTTSKVPPATTTTVLPVATTRPSTVTQPPATTIAVSAPLMFVEPEPVELKMGSTYRERLVTGGLSPFEFSVISGNIAEGLDVDDSGFLNGPLGATGRFEAIVEVVDSADQLATGMVAFVVKEYRIVTARGGSVTVVVTGQSAEFFSALQAEGYESPQVVRTGPLVVEVTFVPRTGNEASWVRCEVVGEVVCTHG